MNDFVHLHVHTHYSLLDGACTPAGLLKLCQEQEMCAVAMTDHGYMGGAIDMYHTFHASGVKPIIGCEAYVSPTTRFDRDPNNQDIRGFHLLLLAENMQGYHSLCKLLSEAYINGMYYKPRVDKELLRQYHDGLICLSACIGGEIPQAVLRGDSARADELIAEHMEIFGRDHFFLEIMDHGIPEEVTSNRYLIQAAKRFNIPLAATNDVHYQRKSDAKAHEIMLCVQTNAKLEDPRHFRFSGPEFYFKTEAEMREIFHEVPEAVTNTRGIAERCEIEFKFAPDVNHYPVFPIPTGEPEQVYLRKMCCQGVKERFGFDPDAPDDDPKHREIVERMDYELGIIEKTKYCSYFLVVSDFIRHAKSLDIPVGPGRGSGAGSLVAYLTRITDIDPLRYGLLFERFLNPERVSPPDFDVDFCEDRRGEVIDYVRKKYGEDSVAQICTYGQMKAKAVVKDIARVLGRSFADGDRITKLIPNDPKMTLKKALDESRELRELCASEPWVREIFDYAEVLEGVNRQLGIHAAGVIIGDQRLDNLVPLTLGAQKEVITEFPALYCEQLGLLKMDFLGLRTITTIKRAVDLIRETRGVTLDMGAIPLNDPKTYDLLRRGDTIAVFQLESEGMQNLCRQFGVDTIEHIIALLAIYRPGPMQFIPQFVARKRGREEVVYDHPEMEKYLRETYGIMLYQEQIMQVVQALAGFSLGGADILRRAIGKKKKHILDEQKAKFIAGCKSFRGISEEKAQAIWEKIELFAGYGFNKSHSAAYAFVSYQTAYLKANYPVEFMAAVLTAELANADKIAFLIRACKDMRIPVLPPDVNSSGISFSVAGETIRFGLGAIKGVGETAAKKIIEARNSGGRFRDFTDFCERAGDGLNSRMIEHLTRAGAFDSLGLRRSQILAIAEPTMAFASSRQKELAAGQGSLFDLLDAEDRTEICSVPVPDIPEFDESEILHSEKELLGFYVSGHPLGRFAGLARAFTTVALSEPESLADNQSVRITGILKSIARKNSQKNGSVFYVAGLEAFDGEIDCMFYPRALEKIGDRIHEFQAEDIVVVEGFISKRSDEEAPRLTAEDIRPIREAIALYGEELIVYLEPEDAEKMPALAEIVRRHQGGGNRLVIGISADCGGVVRRVFVDTSASVAADIGMLRELEELLGASDCWKLKANDKLPEPRRRWQGEKSAK